MNEIINKARFFFEEKITTHVDTLGNSFFNGLIIELHETQIIINDRVLGLTPIAFSEIKTIETFREVRE